jgi:hypothetical protein
MTMAMTSTYLEKVELARHLPQFLALAGKFLRDVDRHLPFGHPAGATHEHLGLHPFQPRTLRVACELLFHEFAAGAVIGADERRFGRGP